MNLVEKTHASSYQTGEYVDPAHIEFAIARIIERIRTVGGEVPGKLLTAYVRDTDCPLSPADISRVLYWACSRAILVRSYAEDETFVYSLSDEFEERLSESTALSNADQVIGESILEAVIGMNLLADESSSHSLYRGSADVFDQTLYEQLPEHFQSQFEHLLGTVPAPPAGSGVKIAVPSAVTWMSVNGSGKEMTGITVAMVPRRTSGYAHIPGDVAKRRYRDNFKDVSEQDRCIVFNPERGSYYAPPIEVLRYLHRKASAPSGVTHAVKPEIATGAPSEKVVCEKAVLAPNQERKLQDQLSFSKLLEISQNAFGDRSAFPTEVLVRLINQAEREMESSRSNRSDALQAT